MAAAAFDPSSFCLVISAAASCVLASGARVEFRRGKNGDWGYAGLAKRAEEDKLRAWHDLELVRASAADFERAAARAGK